MKTKRIETMIENYINGNLADARRQSKRFTEREIRWELRERYDWSEYKSFVSARWLKGGDCWQEACDAV